VPEEPADLELVLELVDEAEVLLVGGDNMLQGIELLRAGVIDGVDRAEGALADAGDDLIAEQRLG